MGRLDSALQASTFYNLDIQWSTRTYGTNEVRFAYYPRGPQSRASHFFTSVQRDTEESVVLAGRQMLILQTSFTASSNTRYSSRHHFLEKQLGVSLIPRHGFILWLAILEKLSTMDKPWVPSAENGCVLCGGLFDETHDHLFFKCWYSKRCLTILKRQIKFQWPYIDWQRGLMWASKRWRGNHLINAAFRATLAALVYHLWAERNKKIFSNTASAEYITSRV
ncbi:UNVERIFIED_CONTAM: hypothetical protein Scaly_3152400 [Sesamum calycinum]|uniref:Reverse transcriptase zinc-binding domain-containing protein n=1 Tax=Sesamum calycinum TaxID=2727403 RepID=A0AAW2JEP9_9LAMI